VILWHWSLTLTNIMLLPIMYDPEDNGLVSILFSTEWCYDIDLWPLTLTNNRLPFLIMVKKLTVWSLFWLQDISMKWCSDFWLLTLKNNMLLPISISCQQGVSTKWCYNLDLWPWKTKVFFLSWWWSSVLNCMILTV
jgi:hypothetical protein